ncbi:MAG: macro domain-containing protein [Bacteroidales bacterium]|nr:macro domain-containing protein [Bacteroidales bacterium]
MIKYIAKGDIFRISGVSNYAHGCNCAGAMGKGIAVSFRDKYPEMYLEYKQLCKKNMFRPGDVFDYNYADGHIYNLGTQLTWRTPAKIEYIENALIQMLELASRDNVTAIALPAIGAGLGGLKWDDVKSIIEKVSNNYPDVNLYVVETYQKE